MLKISTNANTQAKFMRAYNSVSQKLKDGPISFRTYKDLVCYLGLPDLTNKSTQKKKQLEKLSHFFTYTRSKYSFTITEAKIPTTLPPVYSLSVMEEKGIAPTFKLLNNYLILNHLKSFFEFTGENKLVISKKNLANELGYINPLFLKASYSYETVADVFEIPYEFSRSFFEVVSRSYGSLMESSLEELQKAGLIIFQCVLYGHCKVETDNPLKRFVKKDTEWRKLSDDEIKIYTKGISEFFKDNNIFTMQDVFLKGLKIKFFSFIDEYMKENANISGVVKMLEIFFDEELLNRCLGYEDYVAFISPARERIFLNNKFIEKQIKNFEKRDSKDVLEIGWGTMKNINLSLKDRKRKFKDLCLAFIKDDITIERAIIENYL